VSTEAAPSRHKKSARFYRSIVDELPLNISYLPGKYEETKEKLEEGCGYQSVFSYLAQRHLGK